MAHPGAPTLGSIPEPPVREGRAQDQGLIKPRNPSPRSRRCTQKHLREREGGRKGKREENKKEFKDLLISAHIK